VAGGIQETMILDELIDRDEDDEENIPRRIMNCNDSEMMLQNPLMHESMADLERNYDSGYTELVVREGPNNNNNETDLEKKA
jgi:hypothetical protein